MKVWIKSQFFRDETEGPDTKVEKLGQLQDIANRYLMVAPHYARRVVGTLIGGINCRGDVPNTGDPFMEPITLQDLELVASTMLPQISTRPVENIITGLRFIGVASEYTEAGPALWPTGKREELYV